MEKGEHFVLNAVAQAIYDKKGMNILALDVRNCSSLTDYVIIAEGLAPKHVIALSHAVEKSLSELGYKAFHEEGQKIGDWVVIDYMQVMIHIFAPGFREKYCLEELWREADIVDLSIDVSSLTGGSSAEAMRSVSF